MSIEIRTFTGKDERNKFIKSGLKHYEGNDCYISPLIFDELGTVDKQ